MRSAPSTGQAPTQPIVGRPSPSIKGPSPVPGFQGFHILTANFTQVPNEIWDLRLPGLTYELRWTLATLARETVGEAYRRGGSPYAFVPITWTRWIDLLELKSLNAVKTRLARLEALGVLEVKPGKRSDLGTTPNLYRLRWENDGKASSRTFHGVIQARGREISRKRTVRTSSLGGYQPADTPSGGEGYQAADTPRVSAQADTPSFKQTEESTQVQTQSVSPSVPAPDGLTALGSESVACDPWLKASGPEAWPEPLLEGLGAILDPPQVAGVEARSPWSAEGAWAIFQAITANGKNLRNRPGTLWNALTLAPKGADWLLKAGPALRAAGWQMEPGDGTDQEPWLRARGSRALAKEGYHRLPLAANAVDHSPGAKERQLMRTSDPLFLELETDESLDYEAEGPELPPAPENLVEPRKAEDLNPATKAELRSLIENLREASRAALRSNPSRNPGFFDACSQCWQSLGAALEPVIPLQVTLPEEKRPLTIRSRAQIKMNVINALYQAVS